MPNQAQKKIEQLLKRKETSTLDFKSRINLLSDKDKYEFSKDISAFANSRGGYIIYGKQDEKDGGNVIGIDVETYDSDQMHQIIAQRCNPPPEFKDQLVEFENKQFVLIRIPESNTKPHEIVQSRDVWIRRGATSDKATQKEREKIGIKQKESLANKLETEGIPEKSEGILRIGVLKFGRWYMTKKYGSLNHSVKNELILISLFIILLLAPLFFVFYQTSSAHSINTALLVGSVFSTTGSGIFIMILIGIPKLQCPKCKRQFAVRRKKSIRVKTEVISNKEREIIYHNHYACDYCRFKTKRFEIETEKN